MSRILSAVGLAIALSSTAAIMPANAKARCDGDFERVGGSWIATRRCQEHEADKVARGMHQHVTDSPSSAHDVTPDEFCRGNNDIRVSSFCSSYKD